MTIEELKEALLQGASNCFEMHLSWWNNLALKSTEAFDYAATYEHEAFKPIGAGEPSAFFLLMVREKL